MKIIYADGSSLGNPGPGGYGVLAIDKERNLFWEYGGGEKNVTNNQMELRATILALKLILKSKTKKGEVVEMRLDSKYVIDGVTKWSTNWLKNGWLSANKKPVKNKEFWIEILRLLDDVTAKIKWVHVYGHMGEKYNERVDVIAKAFAGNEKIELAKAKPVKK